MTCFFCKKEYKPFLTKRSLTLRKKTFSKTCRACAKMRENNKPNPYKKLKISSAKILGYVVDTNELEHYKNIVRELSETQRTKYYPCSTRGCTKVFKSSGNYHFNFCRPCLKQYFKKRTSNTIKVNRKKRSGKT